MALPDKLRHGGVAEGRGVAVPPRKAPAASEGSQASAAGARREQHRIPSLPSSSRLAGSASVRPGGLGPGRAHGHRFIVFRAAFGGIPAFPAGSRGGGRGGGRGRGGARTCGPAGPRPRASLHTR